MDRYKDGSIIHIKDFPFWKAIHFATNAINKGVIHYYDENIERYVVTIKTEDQGDSILAYFKHDEIELGDSND